MKKEIKATSYSRLNAGHSMLEMLGVLAVIGVLSIGGLNGYNYAMGKKKADDLFTEIQMKTLFLIEKDLTKYIPGEEITFPEFKNAAFDVKMYRLDPATNSDAEYEIEIANISSLICKEILKKKINTPYVIQVGEKEFDPSNPDYSVCDQFDEQNTFNFISKAYAAEGVTIRIPMPDPSSPAGYPQSLPRTEDDCQKKEGQWMASSKQCCMGEVSKNSVYGERCCKNGQKKVSLVNDNTQSTCCPSEKVAAYTIGDKEGIGCCAGEVYQISSGKWGCCDDPEGMYSDEKDPGDVGAVTSISFSELCSSGEQKWCCAPGWSAYCTDRVVPQCCDGEVLKVAGNAQCCEKGNIKMQIFDSSEEWCCKNGEKPFLTDGGARCCAGEPYKSKQADYDVYAGDYGCCKKEDGRTLVNVFGADDSQACCLSSQYGYYDKPNDAVLCCNTEPTFDEEKGSYICGCLESETEQSVLGGHPLATHCCPKDKMAYAKKILEPPLEIFDPTTGKYEADISGVKTYNACCPSNSLAKTSVGALDGYECCDGEEQVHDVLFATDGTQMCCGKDEKAYLNNTSSQFAIPRCCKGIPYQDSYQKTYCCVSDTHVLDESVEGSSRTGDKYCCPKDMPNAFWIGEQYKCCADDEDAYWNGSTTGCCSGTLFKNGTNTQDCCTGSTYSVVSVQGASIAGLQYCCASDHSYAYQNGTSVTCCPETKKYFANGQCVECTIDSHCADGQTCNTSTFVCEEETNCNPLDVKSCDTDSRNLDTCVAENQPICEACSWQWDDVRGYPGFTEYGCGGDAYCQAQCAGKSWCSTVKWNLFYYGGNSADYFYQCGGGDAYCKAKYGANSVWAMEEGSTVVGCWSGNNLQEEWLLGITGPITQ